MYKKSYTGKNGYVPNCLFALCVCVRSIVRRRHSQFVSSLPLLIGELRSGPVFADVQSVTFLLVSYPAACLPLWLSWTQQSTFRIHKSPMKHSHVARCKFIFNAHCCVHGLGVQNTCSPFDRTHENDTHHNSQCERNGGAPSDGLLQSNEYQSRFQWNENRGGGGWTAEKRAALEESENAAQSECKLSIGDSFLFG